jgi:drug/metabolite transporter (DMT)-like permease
VWNVASGFSAITIPSGQSAVLGFTMPLWVAVLSAVFLGERLQARNLLALALGAAGVLLLLLPGLQAYANAPFGFAAGILAGLGWAGGTVMLKRHPIPVPAIVSTGWQLLLSSVPVGVLAVALHAGPVFLPSTLTVVVVSYITMVPMAVGNLWWFSIAGQLPANVAGLSVIMVPVVAMISGALMRGEPLGPPQVAAMACCMGALALTILKPKPASAG